MILGPDWSVADDGWPFLALAGTITIVTSIIFLPLGCFLLGIMVWLAHVLRVPTRQTRVDNQTIYAPCDGIILEIVPDVFPMGFPNDSERPSVSQFKRGYMTRNCRLVQLQAILLKITFCLEYSRVGVIIQSVGKLRDW